MLVVDPDAGGAAGEGEASVGCGAGGLVGADGFDEDAAGLDVGDSGVDVTHAEGEVAQALGLSPDALAATGFLSTGPSQTRNQSLSLALQGVRASITALVGRTVTSRLAAGLNQGDLANNARIEQRAYSLTGSYQLSPVSALALSATRQEAQGDAAAARTQLTSWFANWNARLGARLSVQLGARHSRSEGSAEYTENSV